MNAKLIGALVAVLVVAGVGLVLINGNNKKAAPAPTPVVVKTKTPTPSPSVKPGQATVVYKAGAFSPANLTVKVGQTVTFMSEGGSVQVASDPHPQHTNLPGFDSKGPISQGKSYTFTFTKKGTWGY